MAFGGGGDDACSHKCVCVHERGYVRVCVCVCACACSHESTKRGGAGKGNWGTEAEDLSGKE